MTPDIFPHQIDLAIEVAPGSRVNRPSQLEQLLRSLQTGNGARQCAFAQHGRRANGCGPLGQLIEALRAAQTATGTSGKRSPMLLEDMSALGRDLHLHLDAVVALDDLHIVDFAGATDDAFAKAEAEGEVLKILGRGKHDRMGNAVVHQRHRHFFGNRLQGMHGDATHPALRAVSVMCLDAHSRFAFHRPPRLRLQESNLPLFLLRYTLPSSCAIVLYHIRVILYCVPNRDASPTMPRPIRPRVNPQRGWQARVSRIGKM